MRPGRAARSARVIESRRGPALPRARCAEARAEGAPCVACLPARWQDRRSSLRRADSRRRHGAGVDDPPPAIRGRSGAKQRVRPRRRAQVERTWRGATMKSQFEVCGHRDPNSEVGRRLHRQLSSQQHPGEPHGGLPRRGSPHRGAQGAQAKTGHRRENDVAPTEEAHALRSGRWPALHAAVQRALAPPPASCVPQEAHASNSCSR